MSATETIVAAILIAAFAWWAIERPCERTVRVAVGAVAADRCVR